MQEEAAESAEVSNDRELVPRSSESKSAPATGTPPRVTCKSR